MLVYSLGRSEFVKLEVFDVSGRKIGVADAAERSMGSHSVYWDSSGPGVYFARLSTKGGTSMKPVLVLE
jgi:hypothetical protein